MHGEFAERKRRRGAQINGRPYFAMKRRRFSGCCRFIWTSSRGPAYCRNTSELGAAFSCVFVQAIATSTPDVNPRVSADARSLLNQICGALEMPLDRYEQPDALTRQPARPGRVPALFCFFAGWTAGVFVKPSAFIYLMTRCDASCIFPDIAVFLLWCTHGKCCPKACRKGRG